MFYYVFRAAATRENMSFAFVAYPNHGELVYLSEICNSGNTPCWIWNCYCKEFIGAIRLLKFDLSHPYPCLTRTLNECYMQCMCTMWFSKWRSGWIKGIYRRLTAIEPGPFRDACPLGSTRRLVLINTNSGCGSTVISGMSLLIQIQWFHFPSPQQSCMLDFHQCITIVAKMNISFEALHNDRWEYVHRFCYPLTVHRYISCVWEHLTFSKHYRLLVKVLMFIAQLLMLWTIMSLPVNIEYERFLFRATKQNPGETTML